MTLLQMSVMGAVLIGFVTILKKILGHWLSPGCYLFLWLAVGIRLLVPVTIVSPFSVYQFLQLQDGMPTMASGNVAASHMVSGTEPMVLSPMTEPAMFPWLSVLWIVGAICVFLQFVFRHWQNRKRYRTSLPVRDAFVTAWQAKHPLGRKYQIRQSQLIDTPLAYGIVNPVILLPSNRTKNEAAMEFILLHEWHHIRHWDAFWQWMLVILCSLYWFHPAVWWMCLLCRQELELFCDCAVSGSLRKEQRRAYAQLLLEQAGRSRQMPLFSQFGSVGYHQMEERVRIIMKQKRVRWKPILATLVLLCAGGLCFATSAIGAMPPNVGEQTEAVVTMAWPVQAENTRLTLNYGVRIHPITKETMEIDHICIGAENGADIIAAASGVVTDAGFDGVQGNYLVVQCAEEMELRYWHCETLLASVGDRVAIGDVIATLGQTGNATGPCLSFAVYQNGVACDPMEWLKNG